MFKRLRRKLHDHEVDKQHRDFDRAAAESESQGEGEARARDLPDQLGDFNETQRMGPGMLGGGSGGTGVGV
jgi:hypothetical protein